MKKIMTTVLTVLLCGVCTVLPATAVTPPMAYGDFDNDGKITITDITFLQEGLAELIEWDWSLDYQADYNHDGVANIQDVTCLQRKLAEMDLPESYGGAFSTYILVDSFEANYSSGTATVGVPITFTAHAYGGEVTYAFYINGTLVQPRSEDNTLTYFFDQPGDYEVLTRAYNEDNFYNENGYYSYKIV